MIQKNEEKIIKCLTTLTNKEKYYYIMLTDYYKKCKNEDIQQMLDIINGKSILSLRIIDWFVTRCSFKYKICIENEDELFNIYVSYKAQLKSYKKKYFDPFRRNSKFFFHYDINDETKYIYTTFGQLNFFKWAISNNILLFIKNNFNFIISAMTVNKDSKIRKKNNIKNKHSQKEIKLLPQINLICNENIKNNILTLYSKIKEDCVYSNLSCCKRNMLASEHVSFAASSHMISYKNNNNKQILCFENKKIPNNIQIDGNLYNINCNFNNINSNEHKNVFFNIDIQKNIDQNIKKNVKLEVNSITLNKPITLYFD